METGRLQGWWPGGDGWSAQAPLSTPRQLELSRDLSSSCLLTTQQAQYFSLSSSPPSHSLLAAMDPGSSPEDEQLRLSKMRI